jgi:hypothetical protein
MPSFVPRPSQRKYLQYYTKPGDTIFHIAFNTIGSPFRWRELADINNLSDPLDLPEVLLIPVSERIV